MGEELDHDIVGSLLARFVSVSVPKNGPIPAQGKVGNFGPIYLQFTAN